MVKDNAIEITGGLDRDDLLREVFKIKPGVVVFYTGYPRDPDNFHTLYMRVRCIAAHEDNEYLKVYGQIIQIDFFPMKDISECCISYVPEDHLGVLESVEEEKENGGITINLIKIQTGG